MRQELAAWAFILLVCLVYFLVKVGYQLRPRRRKEPKFAYVYVNSDGSARECTTDEREHLGMEFEPLDGNRPYIKFNYEARTPVGDLQGFLRRRLVPRRILISPAPDSQDHPLWRLKQRHPNLRP